MQGKHLLGTSKETSVVLEEIKNAPGGGFLYTLSDKAPAAGSYEYITGGVAGVGDLILSTTMLMRTQPAAAGEGDGDPRERLARESRARGGGNNETDATPSTSASADVSPVASPATAPTQTPTSQPANDNRLFVSLPDRTWQLAIGQSNLQILQDEMSPDRRARHVSAVDPNTGMNIAIFLEPAATIGDVRLARSFFFDRLRCSPLQIREDKFTEQGDIARVDYLLPDVNQRHANLYISKEGIWVDVHISVEDAQNEKLPLIDEIAKSVRIEAKARATK